MSALEEAAFQAEGTAGAKAPQWKGAWPVHGAARRPLT